jgi:hypothetical protein
MSKPVIAGIAVAVAIIAAFYFGTAVEEEQQSDLGQAGEEIGEAMDKAVDDAKQAGEELENAIQQ